MDLTTIRTELRKKIGNPTVGDVADIDLTNAINAAYEDIITKYRFHKARKVCTFMTVAGQSRYGLPPDCSVVYTVRDNTNQIKLTKYDMKQLADRLDDTVTNKPEFYTRVRDWIQLIQTPDDVYEIEVFYKVEYTPLVNGTDIPVLPSSWHRGIVSLARYHYFDTVLDLPKAQYALDAYNLWVKEQPVEVDEEKVDFDSGVRIPELEEGVSRQLDFDHSP